MSQRKGKMEKADQKKKKRVQKKPARGHKKKRKESGDKETTIKITFIMNERAKQDIRSKR